MCAVLLVGCGSKAPEKAQKKKPKPPVPDQVIETTSGTATYRGAKRERLWDVSWQNGTISIPGAEPRGVQNGAMSGVSGVIYKDEKVTTRFKAKRGTVDQKSKILTLTDGVEVTSLKPDVRLLCDKLVYDGRRKFYRAIGHVQVLGSMGTVGTLPEVLANANLTKIASPEMFGKP